MLLEALVAAAILALLVGSALAGVTWTLAQGAARMDRAWLTELARSVADEYRMTRDPGLASGTTPSGLSWQVSTTTVASRPPPGSGLDDVTVTAWREAHPDREVTLRLLVRTDAP